MTQGQWDEVFRLFHEALDKGHSERTSFLESSCPDAAIRAEVQSLLANSSDADPLLSAPAMEGAREAIEAAMNAAESGVSARREQLIASLTGATIVERYRVVGCIGRGGHAVVLLALDLRVGNRKVVVKVLDSEEGNRGWLERKFRQEMEALAKINHPGIVGVSDCGRLSGGQPFIVMNFVDGINLRERMRTALTREEIAEIVRQMGSALGAAHDAGVVHLDLKPENVMLESGGKAVSVKLIDFGIARMFGTQGDSVATGNMVAGTATYMAPEQFQGMASPASDIYAMGVICFEMLTGSKPQILAPGRELPGGVRQLLTPAFAHEPGKRPANAEAFGNSLSGTLQGRKGGRIAVLAAAAAILALLAGGAYLLLRSQVKPLTDKDVLVLADFVNSTGDTVFDGTLREALAVALEDSPFLSIMGNDQVNQTLQLMGHRRGEHITNDIAREVCQRQNEKATIGGSIALLGRSYVVALQALDCKTGEALAHEQVQADSKEQVLKAVSSGATAIRAKLGESLSSIQKPDQRLAQVTTTSLEAVQAWALGRVEEAKGVQIAALPFVKRATELDPNFAMAWLRLGTIYSNAGESAQAAECYRRAYSLRDRVSEREKLDIEGSYYARVTGERDKAIETFKLYSRMYPRAFRPHVLLGNFYVETGDFENSIPEYQEASRLNPRLPIGFSNMAESYIALDRFEDAKATIRAAYAKHLTASPLHVAMLEVAGLIKDQALAEEELHWFAGKPVEYEALSVESGSAAQEGKLREAARFLQQAIAGAKQRHLEGASVAMKGRGAAREAVAGDCRRIRSESNVTPPPDLNPSDLFPFGFAGALCGNAGQVEKLAAETSKRRPDDNVWRAVYLPTINAVRELNQNQPAKAIELLQSAVPYKWAYPEPIYLRALANLRLHQAPQAIAGFQDILAHRGAVGVGTIYPASYVGLARAKALSRDIAGAKKAYEDFFSFWKDADSDVPLLVAARKEYAALH